MANASVEDIAREAAAQCGIAIADGTHDDGRDYFPCLECMAKVIGDAIGADRQACPRGPKACDVEIEELRRQTEQARSEAAKARRDLQSAIQQERLKALREASARINANVDLLGADEAIKQINILINEAIFPRKAVAILRGDE